MTAEHRVRAGCKYRYVPVPIDEITPPFGVEDGNLTSDDIVKVVNKYGCPKANTMGHCHIETLSGHFLGLVHTNSLKRI